MTKAKGMLSVEEHKRLEEERQRPFRTDITDVGNDTISIKPRILVSKDQYDLIQKICSMTDTRLEEYIKDALMQMIEVDIQNPSCFGQMVCEVLRKEWDSIKPQK